jgi:hypothetical protein
METIMEKADFATDAVVATTEIIDATAIVNAATAMGS